MTLERLVRKKSGLFEFDETVSRFFPSRHPDFMTSCIDFQPAAHIDCAGSSSIVLSGHIPHLIASPRLPTRVLSAALPNFDLPIRPPDTVGTFSVLEPRCSELRARRQLPPPARFIPVGPMAEQPIVTSICGRYEARPRA